MASNTLPILSSQTTQNRPRDRHLRCLRRSVFYQSFRSSHSSPVQSSTESSRDWTFLHSCRNAENGFRISENELRVRIMGIDVLLHSPSPGRDHVNDREHPDVPTSRHFVHFSDEFHNAGAIELSFVAEDCALTSGVTSGA